jgi:hypothetical protein
MKLRIGLLDIAGAGVALVALVLPAPAKQVYPIYDKGSVAQPAALAAEQAALSRDPHDFAALGRYVDLLAEAGQPDQALRAAGAAYADETPGRWRAAIAVASVHADLLDAKAAYDWAEKALAACDAPGSDCRVDHERVRIELYAKALKAGIDSGIDPKVDPDGFKKAIDSATPMIHVGGRHNHPPL